MSDISISIPYPELKVNEYFTIRVRNIAQIDNWQYQYLVHSNEPFKISGLPPAAYVLEIVHVSTNLIPSRPTYTTINTLIAKGYDCGFAHISSLIEAGIAIKKTTNG